MRAMSVKVVTVEADRSRRSKRLPSLLSRLRKKVLGGRRAQREEFESILDVARSVAAQDAEALPALVRLIGRGAQARAMNAVLRRGKDANLNHVEPGTVLFELSAKLTPNGGTLDDLMRQVPAPRPMLLGVDLILPWPWNRGRIVNSLCNLRPGGRWGTWRQDENHLVVLWLPLGIGWVAGGNHSLTAGILHAKGRIKPEATYDVSEVYKHVVCDGVEYKRKHDGKVISPVTDLEIAAIFEIGRIIHKRRISF